MPAVHWPPILSHRALTQDVGRAFRQANKIRRLPPCSSDNKLLHCQTQITFQCCSDRGFRDKAERTIKTLRTSVCVSLSERPSGCVWGQSPSSPDSERKTYTTVTKRKGPTASSGKPDKRILRLTLLYCKIVYSHSFYYYKSSCFQSVTSSAKNYLSVFKGAF